MSLRHKLAVLLAAVIFYGIFYLNWYWMTPLGMTPVLDGAENMALAEKIYQGTLPVEPFYRAMLYPFMLASLRFVGVEPDMMMSVAGLIGLLFHVLTTLLVALIARALWKSETACLLGGALYGFYPLAVYFAAEPLDITAAIFFLCLSIYLYLQGSEKKSNLWFFSAGLMIGIGGLLRANVLAAAGIFAMEILMGGQRRKSLLALSAVVLMVVAGGLVGWHHSGEFRLMPWQGAFVLYSANSAKANGKYFNQTIFLPDRDLSYNPARLESEILYIRETGATAIPSLDDFNRFWRDKTLRYITENPGQWSLLLLRKLYYLANNFEQYNNKTFAFHRDLAPLLRYNPLCWGILLIAAVLAFFNRRGKNADLSRVLLALLLLAAGTLVFLVSARFRLLLVPLLAALASGILQINFSERVRLFKNLAVAAIVALITFSTLFGAADMSTINSDRLLLAHACARIYDFAGQVYWADQVLREIPDHPIAARVKVVGFTNLVFSGEKGADNADWQTVSRELEWLAARDLLFPDTAFISGCYAFNIKKDREKALQIWTKALNLYPEKNLYLSALVYAGSRELSATMDAPVGSLLWYLKIKEGLQPMENEALFKQMRRAAVFFWGAE